MTLLVGKMVRSVYLCCILSFLVLQAVVGQNLRLEHIRTFNGHQHGVKRVIFSPDGVHFASGGTRGEIFIWSIEGETGVKKLEGHYGSVLDLRYSEDGKFLVSTGEDGQVKVWDANTGFCLQRIVSPSSPESPVNKVNFAVVCSSAGMVYFGGTNKFLCQVPLKSTSEPEVIYTDPKEAIRCAQLSPDGKELIFAAGQYLMALSLKSGEIDREYNTGSCLINSMEFSNDGERLLTWCHNSRVDMRDPSNFYLSTSFRSGSSGRKFSNLAFTEDGKYVVTGDYASRFNVWDLSRKQLVLDQGADQGTILSFDLENGPNYILSGSLDKSIKLWKIVEDVPEPQPKKKPVKHVEPIAEELEPEVEIVVYEQPIQDVKQVEENGPAPTNINVVIKETEPVVTTILPEDRVDLELQSNKNNRRVKPIRKEHRLTFGNHFLTFNLWDAQVVDGDIVSIYVGDDCIVKEFSITGEKKQVTYDASKFNKVYVYLHAHNLGTQPPNTVTMTISDGVSTHSVELRSDLTGSSAMELIFEEPQVSE